MPEVTELEILASRHGGWMTSVWNEDGVLVAQRVSSLRDALKVLPSLAPVAKTARLEREMEQ